MKIPVRSLWLTLLWLPALATAQTTYYADCVTGSNTLDGLSATITNGHGPKLNIAAGITAASNGDTLSVAQGFYQETNWLAGAGRITILPQGTVTIYSSDPWTTDSDGDGIPDEWEVAYGLNPFDASDAAQASTLPWAQGLTNLEVYQLGLDPRNADALPPEIEVHYSSPPNETGWWHTNVTVWFTATNAIYHAPGGTVSFLGETNDAEIVGTAVNAAGVVVQTSALINIDMTPPVITMKPGNLGTNTLSDPMLQITYNDPGSNAVPSGLNLSTLHITVDGNDVTTNFYISANGAVGDMSDAPPGWHTNIVSIADYADNVLLVTNLIYATGVTNPNAPAMDSLDLGDGATILPDIPEIWVQGTVGGGTNSLVSASVNGGEPIQMNRRDNIFGYLLPLDPGTNVIVLTAADSTTNNLSSKVLLVERSTRFQAAITNLVFGAFADGTTQTVAGTVSLYLDAGSSNQSALTNVTVNGVNASWTDNGDGTATFTTDDPLPPPCSAMPVVVALAFLNGTILQVPLGLLEGYEITERHTSGSQVNCWGIYHNSGPCGPDLCPDDEWRVGYFSSAPSTQTWTTAFVSPCMQPGNNYNEHTETADTGNQCIGTTNSDNIVWNEPEVTDTTNAVPQPDRGLVFGTQTWYEDFKIWDDYCVGEGELEDLVSSLNSTNDGSLTFVRPLNYSDGQPVIFTLEGLTYTTVAGETVDVSQVKFKLGGDWQDPVAVTNNPAGGWDVSYSMTVGTDLLASNTIDASCFQWPSSSTNYSVSGCVDNACPWGPPFQKNETYTAHQLSFTGFHNQLPTCGPDVTVWVYSVLSDVYAKWNGWDSTQRCVACETLIDPLDYTPGIGWWIPAAGAWDIYALNDIGTGSFIPPTPGSPTNSIYYFERSVTFQNHCYYAGAVNYALWGQMFNLCAGLNSFPLSPFSENRAVALMWAWKVGNSWRYWGSGSWQAIEQAAAFSRYGYSGKNPSNRAIPATSDPKNKLDAGKEDWFWLPSFPSVTPPNGACNTCKATHNIPWIPTP